MPRSKGAVGRAQQKQPEGKEFADAHYKPLEEPVLDNWIELLKRLDEEVHIRDWNIKKETMSDASECEPGDAGSDKDVSEGKAESPETESDVSDGTDAPCADTATLEEELMKAVDAHEPKPTKATEENPGGLSAVVPDQRFVVVKPDAPDLRETLFRYTKHMNKKMNKHEKKLKASERQIEAIRDDIVTLMRQSSGSQFADNAIKLRMLLDDARNCFRFAVVSYNKRFLFGTEMKRSNTAKWWTKFTAKMQPNELGQEPRSLWVTCRALFLKPFQDLADLADKAAMEQTVNVMEREERLAAAKVSLPPETSNPLSKKEEVAALEAAKLLAVEHRSFAYTAWASYKAAVDLLQKPELFAYLEEVPDSEAKKIIRDLGKKAAHPACDRALFHSAIVSGRVNLTESTRKDLQELHTIVRSAFQLRGDYVQNVPLDKLDSTTKTVGETTTKGTGDDSSESDGSEMGGEPMDYDTPI